MKEEIKSHLLINDKFLGALLYFKDKDGRGCLKLSFKNKIADFVKGSDIPTTMPVLQKLDNPINLDVSYKFKDNLLEVKKVVNGKIEPEFYNVTLPISTCLFMIKIKDWHLLDDAQLTKNPLVLTPPTQNPSVVIIFSFPNTDGQPISPKEYNCLMGEIPLPEDPLNKFYIGIADNSNNRDLNDFNIYIPFPINN